MAPSVFVVRMLAILALSSAFVCAGIISPDRLTARSTQSAPPVGSERPLPSLPSTQPIQSAPLGRDSDPSSPRAQRDPHSHVINFPSESLSSSSGFREYSNNPEHRQSFDPRPQEQQPLHSASHEREMRPQGPFASPFLQPDSHRDGFQWAPPSNGLLPLDVSPTSTPTSRAVPRTESILPNPDSQNQRQETASQHLFSHSRHLTSQTPQFPDSPSRSHSGSKEDETPKIYSQHHGWHTLDFHEESLDHPRQRDRDHTYWWVQPPPARNRQVSQLTPSTFAAPSERSSLRSIWLATPDASFPSSLTQSSSHPRSKPKRDQLLARESSSSTFAPGRGTPAISREIPSRDILPSRDSASHAPSLSRTSLSSALSNHVRTPSPSSSPERSIHAVQLVNQHHLRPADLDRLRDVPNHHARARAATYLHRYDHLRPWQRRPPAGFTDTREMALARKYGLRRHQMPSLARWEDERNLEGWARTLQKNEEQTRTLKRVALGLTAVPVAAALGPGVGIGLGRKRFCQDHPEKHPFVCRPTR